MKDKKALFGLFGSVLLSSTFVFVPNANAKSISEQQAINVHPETILSLRGGSTVLDAAGTATDLGGLALEIRQIAVQAQNRAGFVKQVMEVAHARAKGRYNVLVFNTSQPYRQNLKGIQTAIPVNYAGVPYVVWIFKRGTFINKGDGGYINWAFRGRFRRGRKNPKFVRFYNR